MGGKVTPCSIAYAAIMLLVSLSSARQWKHASDGMHFPHIYYSIIDYFGPHDDDPQLQAIIDCLLDWWNEQVFPDYVPGGTHGVEDCDYELA
ncbi:hypothetical protein FA13DRAFT_1807810 [Coprinellus micaceus]|uniref:Uncharacterized protein n=1 Tax=Coprinellus micaceus TaxID=71717 RepID=A0A4Y7R5S0_COPMI|nr:hypothetical protein FA13DRAFT_1807810 [Coprinellus micaceus]